MLSEKNGQRSKRIRKGNKRLVNEAEAEEEGMVDSSGTGFRRLSKMSNSMSAHEEAYGGGILKQPCRDLQSGNVTVMWKDKATERLSICFKLIMFDIIIKGR